MGVLTNLEPASVFHYFEEICSIPHTSHHEKALSDYCVQFAKAHGLACRQDEMGNVLIKAPATPGYEKEPGLILQGHLDMVGDKTAACPLDLEKDAIQLVVLGTGEEKYENMFRHFAWKYDKKVSANIYYSEAMSHKIYAAADAFLMPSLFEPCGLSQLMSLRYGTVPIVRETGGLKDTVEPYNEYENTGTGFSFTNYNGEDMLNVINYSKTIFFERKRQWNQIVDRGMAKDFSWRVSAGRYEGLYNYLIG